MTRASGGGVRRAAMASDPEPAREPLWFSSRHLGWSGRELGARYEREDEHGQTGGELIGKDEVRAPPDRVGRRDQPQARDGERETRGRPLQGGQGSNADEQTERHVVQDGAHDWIAKDKRGEDEPKPYSKAGPTRAHVVPQK